MTLKPSIVLLARVHSLEHCKLGEEHNVYQCFSNYPTVCPFYFVSFYRNTKTYDPSPGKKKTIDCVGTN